jgi:hypothetical protein
MSAYSIVNLKEEVEDSLGERVPIGTDRPDGGDGVFVDPAWID